MAESEAKRILVLPSPRGSSSTHTCPSCGSWPKTGGDRDLHLTPLQGEVVLLLRQVVVTGDAASCLERKAMFVAPARVIRAPSG